MFSSLGTSPPTVRQSPADVLREAERILARGATLDDAAVLYLASGSQAPKSAELGIALDVWSELWPRAHKLKSERAVGAVLQAIEFAIDRALASRDAYQRYAGGASAEELDERTREVTARREFAGELYDRGWSRQIAEEALRREREQRWAAAEQGSVEARKALVALLRTAV